jgi:hypothetical protein
MIKQYLTKLRNLIASSEQIVKVEIVRDSIWETDIETIAIIRFKLQLSNGNRIELTERLIQIDQTLQRTKYSYHLQDSVGNLILRYDNAPHFPQISTYPHHKHTAETVESSNELSSIDFLKLIVTEI